MTTQTLSSPAAAQGCGSGSCQCASTAAQPAVPEALVNGIALHAPGQCPDTATLRELAYAELLRQQAVRQGLLPRHTGPDALSAPELTEAERTVIETMVDREVTTPQPTEEEGRRYYEAHKPQFVVGQALHVRHILFAVTPGVNVQALTVHAERALLELSHKGVRPERFAQLAAELSNCPSSAQGGDLGWIGPDDCAPELATELFHLQHAQTGTGVHPRLFHTRFGFHIIDVLERRSGRQPAYEEVRERIAALLTMQSRARALHQYMCLLVGEAEVEGITLEGADSPLVQ
ncbi:peptidylprolyl isomerase [Polaromonas sp. JS666]|uniref:peptidylprolyl isomerase n=1 Tax=Polaromonas sp. (strain JS666 / ATCC BAA-500) TaxID=296591 RepID=UPI0000531E57|nr:peptidylprolyl isomerase [Polaromonas sp. JS666]ABE46474.1 PpiC-type peptidyl-prolyl cis-trans isomerase [Polaromonas sp. JS666]